MKMTLGLALLAAVVAIAFVVQSEQPAEAGRGCFACDNRCGFRLVACYGGADSQWTSCIAGCAVGHQPCESRCDSRRQSQLLFCEQNDSLCQVSCEGTCSA